MSHSTELQAVLPRGWWDGEGWRRNVRLRPIDDVGEESLLDRTEGMLPVERDTALLAECVCDENRNALTPSDVRALSLGDRELLLLMLRRLMLGSTMQCVLQCPTCSGKMDLSLHVEDLLVTPEAEPRIRYEEIVELAGERLFVGFHLPTGGEVEEAIRRAGNDAVIATKLLVQSCLYDVRTMPNGGDAVPVQVGREDWSDGLASAIAARLERLDPQAEIRLNLVCPACGAGFEEYLQTGEYLLQELKAQQRRKYHEVSELAKVYHWSETEILRMGPRKRHRYLELLAADNE